MKRRAMLSLNVLIGCAIIWLIYQFNQLVPGGAFYAQMTEMDATKWSVVVGKDDVQDLLDSRTLCLVQQRDCKEVDSLATSILTKGEPRWTALQRNRAITGLRRQQLMDVSTKYWNNARDAARFAITARSWDAEYAERVIEFREQDRKILSEFLQVLDSVAVDERLLAVRTVKRTQFVFILVLMAVWAFSAVFTDAFVLRPARRSVDPTQRA